MTANEGHYDMLTNKVRLKGNVHIDYFTEEGEKIMISLSANNLVKSYKNRKVVNNVNLEVRKGEIVNF